MKSKIEIVRDIYDNCQAKKVKCKIGNKTYTLLIDQMTATVILKVYNAINEANKFKLMALEWPRIVDICWKQVKKK